MSIIGDRMRELRGPSSQREMADAIGIKQNAWARYELGGALPGAETIIKICRAHACSADWLLGLNDKKSPAGDFLSVKASSGGIAIGANARANAAAKSAADCRTCPYKKWGEKLRKQGLIIPGVE